MGHTSSHIPELDAELDRIEERYKDGDDSKQLNTLITQCLRKYRVNKSTGVDAPRYFVAQELKRLAYRAIEHRQTETFLVFFKHWLAIDDCCDPITGFVVHFALEFVGDGSDTIDPYFDDDADTASAPDDAYFCDLLKLVFRRHRGASANDPSNQSHGGARTPLINAIRTRRPLLVRALIAKGADTSVASYDLKYPLIWAIETHSLEMVKLVAVHSSEAIARINCSGIWRPSMVFHSDDDAEILAYLIDEAGLSPDIIVFGAPLVVSAAQCGNISILECLLARGCNVVEARDNDGKTALDHAQRRGDAKLIEMLTPAERAAKRRRSN